MKCKFIHMSDARGKIAGAVASKNRSGNYFRSKSSPVNPNTEAQQAVRSRFGQWTKAFRNLTPAQIAGWNEGAKSFVSSNVFGDNVLPTGHNLFVALNTNLALVGGVYLEDCPKNILDLNGVELSIVRDVSDASLIGTLSLIPGPSMYVVIYCSGLVSNSVSYVKNKMRVLHVAAASSLDPIVLTSAFVAKYGYLPGPSDKVVFEAVYVDSLTGVASGRQSVSYTYQA